MKSFLAADCSQLFPIPEISESSPCATDDAAKIDANELAKPDFLLCSVKNEPPEIVDSLTEAPPGAETKKQDLKEEKKEFSVIDTLPNDAKTSVKLEAAENREFFSAVEIKNETKPDLPQVAEVEVVAKHEDESRKAEPLVTSSQSPKNNEKQDENGEKATETTASNLEETSTVTNTSSDLSDGKLLTVVASETASDKDPEPSKKSDIYDRSQTEPESTGDVDASNQTKPQSTDDVAPRSADDVVVEPAVGAEVDKLADSSSSIRDTKSSSYAPVDLSGVNGDQIQKADDRTEKTSAGSNLI